MTDAAPRQRVSPELPGHHVHDREEHVLVVEDDAPTRHLIGRLLRENGFRATAARDGEEMWEALRNSNVDLVLLDVMRRSPVSKIPPCRWRRTG